MKSIYPRPYQPIEAHQPPKTPKIDRVSKSSEYRQYFEKHLGYEEILWGLRNEEETYTREEVDELITLMADECGSKKAYVRISGTDYRREDVARRLMNMDNTAFERILYALKWRNPDIIISNRRAYLLTTLFNWPTANPTPYEE